MALLRETNLALLLARLEDLQNATFFSASLRDHVDQLLKVTRRFNDAFAKFDPRLADLFVSQVWNECQFISGSTRHRVPYEVVFCLTRALKDWFPEETLITTAIIQEQNFYFRGGNHQFYELAENCTGVRITNQVVQIMLPELYRHRPLYNLPLFHELGHFVDNKFNVAESILLVLGDQINQFIPDLETKPDGWGDETYKAAVRSHLQEYFADLFAACYVGSAIGTFLEEFSSPASATPTHPSTANRITSITSYLAGTPSALVDIYQSALRFLKLPKLERRFEVPDFVPAIVDFRPTPVSNDAQAHGLFEAAWSFLSSLPHEAPGEWASMPLTTAERIINDLVEKSIRNYMTVRDWHEAVNEK